MKVTQGANDLQRLDSSLLPITIVTGRDDNPRGKTVFCLSNSIAIVQECDPDTSGTKATWWFLSW